MESFISPKFRRWMPNMTFFEKRTFLEAMSMKEVKREGPDP